MAASEPTLYLRIRWVWFLCIGYGAISKKTPLSRILDGAIEFYGAKSDATWPHNLNNMAIDQPSEHIHQ